MATDSISPATEIAQRLQTLGIGTIGATSGWALAVGMEPSQPNNVITVYDTPGQAPDNDDHSVERPTVQVRVRSFDHQEAYGKSQDVKNALISGEFGTFFLITATSEPGLIGRDDNDRFLFTTNFQAMRDIGD